MKKVVQAYKFVSINPNTNVVCVLDEKGRSLAHNLKFSRRYGIYTFYSKGVQYAVGVEWLTPLIFVLSGGKLTCTTNKDLCGTVEQLIGKGYSFSFGTTQHNA